MPYKNRFMHIPQTFDRRRVVNDEMQENMISMYRDGASLHAIAREFNVDRKTVKRYVVPGYKETEDEKQKNAKPWLEYYNREKHREYMKNHRRYKRKLELSNKLIP